MIPSQIGQLYEEEEKKSTIVYDVAPTYFISTHTNSKSNLTKANFKASSIESFI